MAKDFTKSFINLSNWSLSSNVSSELHFNHADGSFCVRPLVVMGIKSIPIESVIMPHLLPKFTVGLGSLMALGVAFEWDKRRCIYSHNSLDIALAGIGLISRNLINVESLSSSIYECGKLGRISSFGCGNFGTGNNMSLNTANQVSLYPPCFTSFLAPLVVKPPVIGVSSEPARINRKSFSTAFNGVALSSMRVFRSGVSSGFSKERILLA